MQKPGRLALVKSEFGANPNHQFLVLAPPKKILKLMEDMLIKLVNVDIVV
jgi:hypothetical protein